MLFSLAVLLSSHKLVPTVTLQKGLIITKSCSVVPRDYLISTPQGTAKAGDEEIPTLSPAIVIKGNNLVVDFAGATLRGTPGKTEPDQRMGLGIVVQGKNITLKHLNVRGYKVGLWAKNVDGLKILDSDLSYNWKQHLQSTLDKEDLSDWQSYHHNEHGEWLRYGAAMYLEGCSNFEVTRTKSVGGQCALQLVRSNKGRIHANDFSFNSGLGLGLYRSSFNKVLNNKLDWCVRGFSYGVYNRGQDSAGILIFEQSSGNLFAFNSVTHGGDGFFLWAGQQTMDNGKGGCNGNVLFGNDFSHSPCNAIEATFSSNAFVNNKLVECWHGIWGGFSYDTKIVGNLFGYNGEAIAIEHGQDIQINHNLFYRDNSGINVWQDPITDKSWGYPKYHDSDSRDYQIYANQFDGITTSAIQIRNTHRAIVSGNSIRNSGTAVKQSGENAGSRVEQGPVTAGKVPPKTISTGGLPVSGTSDNEAEYRHRFDIDWEPFASAQLLMTFNRTLSAAEQRVLDSGLSVVRDPNDPNVFLKPGAIRGQKYILVDQWGPYDFKSPKLWPRQMISASKDAPTVRRRFEILGPVGNWKLNSVSAGIKLTATSGTVPGFVDAVMPANLSGLTQIDLIYSGAVTTDYRGLTTPAGKPVHFGFSQFFTPIDWSVKFFKWNPKNDPRTEAAAFDELIHGQAIKELHQNRLDFAGFSFDPAVGNDHWATICDGNFQVPAGNYTLEVTTDDGARVWVDGNPVITNAWKYQGPTLYTAPLSLTGDRHTIHVDHFQIDGYATLKVSLKPR